MKYPIEVKGKKYKQVKKLNLSCKNLKEIPEDLYNYVNLTKLVLSNNRIKVIPKEILKLKKLKVLDLANNEIDVLQSAVFNLPKLRIFNVYGNNIKKFPKQVYKSGIQKLIVSKNPIEPTELAKLEDFCEVVHVLHEMSNFQNLEQIEDTPQKQLINTKGKSNMEKKNKIFISYSHADKKWLDNVMKFLKPLKRFHDIEVWSDEKIKASDVWKNEIDKALEQATIALLLVSPDFKSSDFIINEELQPLLEKADKEGTKIMPLIVRHSAYFEDYGLSKYQAINDPKQPLSDMTENDQERKLVEMVETIREIIK